MKTYRHSCYAGKFVVRVLLCVFLMTWYSHQLPAVEPTGEIVRDISDEEIPAILNLIAGRIHDNYRQIHSWSGEIEFNVNLVDVGAKAEESFQFTDKVGEAPEVILQKIEEKHFFAVDCDKNYVYIY